MIEQLIDRLWEGAANGLWSDREALDSIADLNPETELGRVLTSVMGKVSMLDMLDPMLGFTRQKNVIRIWFSQHVSKDSLKELVDQINSDYDSGEEDVPPISARIIEAPAPEDSEEKKAYALELRYQTDDIAVPLDVDFSGEVPVDDDDDGETEDEYQIEPTDEEGEADEE